MLLFFLNGPLLSKNERWTFNGNPLEKGNNFTYLGYVFSMKLSFNKMAHEQAVKAKRVLVSLLNTEMSWAKCQNIFSSSCLIQKTAMYYCTGQKYRASLNEMPFNQCKDMLVRDTCV